ncbi:MULTISPECIES: hypothetical protein [Azospirillum]|uniref:Rod shape-determining protein MreD n=1 Tax=Azospirillum brasilense TaxID=192 RepID=A0A6L3B516_AZOBR|nr:hypothetical protein [Azospirillum brasilense]KAA0686145.1 hypothetical protein DS837_10620 [Azospirillum brasilense]
MRILHRIVECPEVNVGVFAFLLNYPWEFWQVPLFVGMASAPHWEAVKFCTRATLGDAAIMLVAFWFVALLAGSRRWILSPSGRQILVFIAVGVAITVLFELLATHVLDRWQYAGAMPVTPVLGIGLSPLAQWIVLPPLVVWFVRRHLR